MNAGSFAPSNVIPIRWPAMLRWRTWTPLLLMLVVALLIRVPFMVRPGFQADITWNSVRAAAIHQNGLFNLYRVTDTDYPPLFLSMLGVVADIQALRGLEMPIEKVTDPVASFLLKTFPVLGDLGLIIVVYLWLRRERWLRWAIPLALAVCPGLILDSAQWGQSDSIMTLFLILVLIALNRDKPRSAWAFFAVAMLTKFQSIVLLPLLLVLTYRRFGLHSTFMGGIIVLAIMGAMLLPFAVGSGTQPTIKPYLGAVGEYPNVTMNAFNIWYALTPHKFEEPLPWPFDQFSDAQAFIGSITYKQFGLLAMGLYALGLCVVVWQRAGQHNEFVWGAALYFAFFMLPTEIHERYLYPTVVLLLIGIVQDRRLWPLAVAAALTFTFNILQVMESTWLVALVAILISVVNFGLFVEVTWVALRPLPTAPPNELIVSDARFSV